MEAPPELSKGSSGALSRSPLVGFLGTEKERGSFYFFRQKTAPQLSGFFGDDFWERLLFQAALHEPSIRYAILALGSLHAESEQDNGLIRQSPTKLRTDNFASKNYSQAIKILVQPLSLEGQQAIDVYLICSILFACLEVSRRHTQASFMLIISRQCRADTVPLSHTSKAVSRSCARLSTTRRPIAINMTSFERLKYHMCR
jgi:hypothetical protein